MIQSINIAIALTSFLLSGLLLIASCVSSGLRERSFRWYFAMVLLTFIGSPSDMLVLALSGVPGRTAYLVMRVVDFISYGVTGLLIVAVALYFYDFISAKVQVPRSFLWFEGIVAALVMLLVLLSQFMPLLATFGANNQYGKGSLYWVYELLCTLSLLTCAGLTFRKIRYLCIREWVSLLTYAFLPIFCYVMDHLFKGLWLAYLGSSISLFLIYLNIQLELKNRLLQKESELADGRITMLLSQIQPHFIFNTLTSISEVCANNPLAQKSLITFSEYLRINMSALTQKAAIPFAQELMHVKQYLWLEQLRFEEKLSVVYDVQVEDFVLPVLSIQPLVENAVKHGITKKAAMGTVWIQTERTNQGVCIHVEDDGVGFMVSAPREEGRDHTGIDNVRTRLWDLCKGRLTIESTPGQGTRVTIFLPEQGESL